MELMDTGADQPKCNIFSKMGKYLNPGMPAVPGGNLKALNLCF